MEYFQRGLAVGECVHLNGLDRLGFAMNHAPNAFGGLSAEYRFSAVTTNSRGYLFHPHGFAVDLEHLTHELPAAPKMSAYMTAKYNYLRRE